MKKKYTVNGMMCTACSSSVERVVNKINGVKLATVNLTAKLLVVECDDTVTDDVIITAVKKAGFEAFLVSEVDKSAQQKPTKMAVRLYLSIAFTLLLSYFSMGRMIGIVPSFLYQGSAVIFYVSLLTTLTIPVLILNNRFFVSGFKALKNKSPNMDTLVGVASLSAFIFGVFSLIMVIVGVSNGNAEVVKTYSSNLYFESSAMILTLVTVGKTLEEKAKTRTESAVSKLKKLAPETATVIKNGEEITVKVSEIAVGDIVVVKAGESASADGEVIFGEGEMNESSITGESLPITVGVGSLIKSATVCVNGYLKIKVTATGSQTVFGKIIDFVESAEATKAPIAKIADKISGIFVPIVFVISLVTLITWLILKAPFDIALSYAISVLVISCPCALGLATPVAITVSMGRSASLGILIKNAETLENVGLVTTAVFDKTGTITYGETVVESVVDISNNDMQAISSIEKLSSHSLAKAITNYVSGDYEVSNFNSVTGKGVSGVVNGNNYYIGNEKFVSSVCKINQLDKAYEYLNKGKTVLYAIKNGEYLGFIVVGDKVKQDSKIAIENLKSIGVKTVILSGDNAMVTESVRSYVNADVGVGEVLPENKAQTVEEYKKSGKVIFVGDGVNDSPALTVADIGVAMGGGTDIAVTSADAVLMNSEPSKIYELIKIGKKTRKIIKQNLFWAFIYNALMIPVASGVFAFIGFTLSPMIAAACMSVSSIFVVTNALRLKK